MSVLKDIFTSMIFAQSIPPPNLDHPMSICLVLSSQLKQIPSVSPFYQYFFYPFLLAFIFFYKFYSYIDLFHLSFIFLLSSFLLFSLSFACLLFSFPFFISFPFHFRCSPPFFLLSLSFFHFLFSFKYIISFYRHLLLIENGGHVPSNGLLLYKQSSQQNQVTRETKYWTVDHHLTTSSPYRVIVT